MANCSAESGWFLQRHLPERHPIGNDSPPFPALAQGMA
jgi:hypothetical protein